MKMWLDFKLGFGVGNYAIVRLTSVILAAGTKIWNRIATNKRTECFQKATQATVCLQLSSPSLDTAVPQVL